jgi:hypothetical protein
MSELKPSSSQLCIAKPRRQRSAWAFDPAWRSKAVEDCVAQLAVAEDQKSALQGYLFEERDPVLRQAVRFRLTGQSVCSDRFAWAYEAHDTNAETGMASALKAMVVADRFSEEIAQELGTTNENVVIFERLFWDIRPILGNESCLRAVVAPDWQAPTKSNEETRDRLILRTALAEGWAGLRALLRGEQPSDEDGEAIAKKIQSMVAQRALRYLRELDASGAAESEDDLKRFLVLRSLRSREAVTSANESEQKCIDFGRAVVALVNHQEGNEVPEKSVKTVMRYLPVSGEDDIDPPASEPRRRRRAVVAD